MFFGELQHAETLVLKGNGGDYWLNKGCLTLLVICLHSNAVDGRGVILPQVKRLCFFFRIKTLKRQARKYFRKMERLKWDQNSPRNPTERPAE